MTATQTKTTRKPYIPTLAAALESLARHAAFLMTQKAPYKGGFGIGETVVEVEIKPAGAGWTEVWDQVAINGVGVGNRHGGVAALALAFEAQIKAVA